MNKTVLAASGALALAVFAFSGPAQAQCWWTGYGYSCASPPASHGSYYQQPYQASPYPAFNAYDFRDYRYKPDWIPSYPGPKPSGGGNF